MTIRHFFRQLIPCMLLAPVLCAAGVEVAVAPGEVLIVPGDGVQKLNFDFLVRHAEKEPLVLLSVRMTAFDAKGALVTQREVNRMGMRPSIEVLGVTEFAPGARTTVLNPFHEFPAAMPLAELRYEFTFTPKESEGEIGAEAVVKPIPFAPRTALRLPLEGKVLVSDGSDFYAHHRRVDLAHPLIVRMGITHNPSRHGMDFMVADAQGRTHKGDGRALDDHYIYGRPVVAPAAGTVADCVDGRRDNPIGEWGVDYEELMRTGDGRLLGGNYIVLDHGNGEASFFAHLQNGSVRVRRGDRVKAGQVLGLVGSSGDSYEPHLHYQLQSGTGFDVDTLPAVFRDFRRYYGSRVEKVRAGTVDTGDLVESR